MTQQGQGDVVARMRLLMDDTDIKISCCVTAIEANIAKGVAMDTVSLQTLASGFEAAHAEITRLRTLLSSSRGEQGWRTIDSAPKDGTWFLICRDDEGPESYEVGCFDPQIWKSYEPAENGLYRQVEKVVNEWRGFNNFHRATHWMPLPSAPGSVPTSLAGQGPDGRKLKRGDRVIRNGQILEFIESELEGDKFVVIGAASQPTAGGDAPIFEIPKSEPNLEPSNVFADDGCADDTDFNRIRDLAFPAIRKHVPCDKPPLIYGCERAECICAEAACDVAGAVSAALSAERARVVALEKALQPFANMAESYEGDPAAFVIASKGGTIISVYDLRGAAAALRALGQQDIGGADHG